MKIKIIVGFIVIISGLWSCSKTSQENKLFHNTEYDTLQVLSTINNVFGWAIEKDFKLFYGSITNDSNFISVTPYNRVKIGFEAVRQDSSFWGNPNFKAVSHELKDLKINFSQTGDIAWFFCYLNDYNTWYEAPANWEDARWTGVLERRNGQWKVVQQHFSFASN